LQAEVDEPVAHELFREAWTGIHGNLRSALVLGIAAAEVATKDMIGKLVPGSEWLVTNLPSPPLVQIVSDYIPQLNVKNSFDGKVVWWDDLVPTLRKGVTLRNQVAHAGGPKLEFDTVESILLTVRDYLWLVDYYSGEEWALKHIRAEVQQKLIAMGSGLASAS
jgi:hypothetical protein